MSPTNPVIPSVELQHLQYSVSLRQTVKQIHIERIRFSLLLYIAPVKMKFTTATILYILSSAVAFSPNSLVANSVASRDGSNGMMRPMVASQDIEANAAPSNGQRKRTKEVSPLSRNSIMHRHNCATCKICIMSICLVFFPCNLLTLHVFFFNLIGAPSTGIKGTPGTRYWSLHSPRIS